MPSVDTVSPARLGGRADRIAARYSLWDVTELPRVAGCGRSVRSHEGVALVVSEGADGRTAGFSGVATCGSVWVCPVCAAKVSAGRHEEISEALAAWVGRGGRVAFVTFTMRHQAGQSLAELWDALSLAWRRTCSGRSWVQTQERLGTVMPRRIRTGARAGQIVMESRVPIIRTVEVTVGPNGWHVHVHAVLLLDGGADDASVRLGVDEMFVRWADALVRQGMARPSYRRGVDVKLVTGSAAEVAESMSDYLVKQLYRSAAELARSDVKTAYGSNRTPFAVLADIVSLGLADDLDLWREWETSSHGRRQVTWSHGLREWLGMGAERSDEELAEEELGGDVAVKLEPAVWRSIVGQRALALVLAAAEVDDVTMMRVLRTFGLRQGVALPRPRGPDGPAPVPV